MSVNAMAVNLATFEEYVKSLLPGLKRQYDRGINRDLSQQQWQDLFKRNVTTVLQQGYRDALLHLQDVVVTKEDREGDDSFLEQMLQPLKSLTEELIQYALHKHRSSCALSNFPEEHNPSQAYLAQVLQQVDQDWSDFVSQVTALLSR